MTLRLKILLLFTGAVAVAAGLTAWNAERYVERQFQQADQQRSDALVAQFRRELSEREAEITTSVQTIADAESTVRMVLDLSRPQADPSVYAGDARGLAASHQLDFLALASQDGTLISSAEWPDRVGYKNDWVTRQNNWNQRGAFLDRVELPDRVELGLMAVRMVHAGNLTVYIIGGQRLSSTFLETLSLPAGMRALFYRNLESDFVPADLSDAEGPISGAESFAPLIQSLEKAPRGSEETVAWSPETNSAERFVTLPLTGRQGEFLGALLLGSVQQQRTAFANYIGSSALMVVAAGLLLALLLSGWISSRVARPLARLSEGIGEVTAGDWETQVETRAIPEIRQTIGAFNKMTRQLADERAGQVARERAAAWRQLAGQLAAELKTLLPPLQVAVKSLARPPERAHDDVEFGDDVAPDALDEVSAVTSAVQQTLETLAACAGKLGEFASLPIPRLEPVNLNDAVRAAVQSFEPRFSAIGRPPINPELFLDEGLGPVRADAVLLRKALDNLLLFIVEDMPAGGTISIHTRRQEGMAHMILSGSGSGLPVQRGNGRSAASDRAARVSGIGLSLATVQSIVSSHGGRISLESAPLAGTTFYLDWPIHNAAQAAALPVVLQNQPEPESLDSRKSAARHRQKVAAQDEQKTAGQEPSVHSQIPELPPIREATVPEISALASSPIVGSLSEPVSEKEAEEPKLEASGTVTEDHTRLTDGLRNLEQHEALVASESHDALEEKEAPMEPADHPENHEEAREAATPVQPAVANPEPAPEPETALSQNLESPAEEPAAVGAPELVLESLEVKADADAPAQPQIQTQAQPETEPQLVEMAQEDEGDLAAVIEEVIETRPRRSKTTELFAPLAEAEDEHEDPEGTIELAPAAGLLLEVFQAEAVEAKAQTAVASPDPPTQLQGAAADSVPHLFGVALPGAQLEAAADPSSAAGDSLPRLFGIAVPDAALDATEGAPAEAKTSSSKTEEHAEDQSANSAQAVAAPSAEASAKTSAEDDKAQSKKEEGGAVRRQAYSPLTYRW